jgi:ADP-dependent NAD(P)H-hydrate dehydratase / NAD(P)H-hydrate epimerase
MVGAPFLAASAALRIGAGLVTIGSDKPVIEKLERRVVEIMTVSLVTDSAKSLSIAEDYIKARKVSVLIIGPGLTDISAPLVLSLFAHVALPTIIDGGALGIVAANRKILQNRAASELILTPHLGELGHFFKQPLPKNQSDILQLAKNLATTEKLTLVVKGHPTHTITATGTIIKNNTGGPALATAGTGDVLSGIIGGIIAQGIPLDEAVPAAVYLHGQGGDLAAKLKTEPGVIASDLIELIPQALKTNGN